MARAAILSALALVAVCSATKITPLEQVVELLYKSLDDGKKMMQEEKVNFAAFNQWCAQTVTERERLIANAEQEMADQKAIHEARTATAKQLGIEIADLKTSIEGKNADIKEAQEIRAKEFEDFQTRQTDLKESISALTRAVATLKIEGGSQSIAQSLIQVKSQVPETKRMINAFLQEFQPEIGFDPTPKAAAYESQSGGIIKILQDLNAKFKTELFDLETAEGNTKAAHGMFVQDTTNEVNQETDQMNYKSEQKAKNEAEAAQAQINHDDAKARHTADSEYLEGTNTLCSQKRGEFGARQEVRTEEIQAIQKAIEILESGKVSGAQEKNSQAMYSRGASMLQVFSAADNLTKKRIVALLNERSKHIHSSALSALAMRLADSPFTKVMEMIEDLIQRLKDQAASEAKQQGWCVAQKTVNDKTRESKTEDVMSLTAEQDKLEALIDKLTESLRQRHEEMKSLEEDMAKATDLRATERADNEQTIKEAQEAQTAVAQATEVLKEFYAKAGQNVNLIQQTPGDDAPGTWDSAYKGQQGKNSGIIGMLEVISSDFERLESDTKADELASQKAFEEFMMESAKTKAQLEANISNETQKLASAKSDLATCKQSLEDTKKELDAANMLHDKLKPVCFPDPVPLHVRQAMRDQEIQSLKECLKILVDNNQ